MEYLKRVAHDVSFYSGDFLSFINIYNMYFLKYACAII